MPAIANKLQQHAQAFRESAAPEVVLKRYASKSKTMSKQEVIRHIFHVCAWIALAQPAGDAASYIGNQDLSPVRVLAKMLGLRGREPLDERGRAAMSAVLSCCDVALQSKSDQRRDDWLKLRKMIPNMKKRKICQDEHASAFGQLDGQLESRRDSQAFDSDLWMFKRVRRFNRNVHKWKSCTLDECQAKARDFETRFALLVDGKDVNTLQLRALLYEVAAALSPPQAKRLNSIATARMDALAAERLHKSALIQKRLRKITTNCISMWRDQLQLEDEQIEQALAHLGNYVIQFEKQYGKMELACAGRAWERLKVAIGQRAANAKSAPAGQEKITKAPTAPTTRGGTYTPSARVLSFPQVKQFKDRPIRLLCSTCQRSIISDWYIKTTNGVRLLIPNQGHLAGRHKKCGTYVPEDGSTLTKLDHIVKVSKALSRCRSSHGEERLYCG